jgi:hypothetical protein
MSLTGARRARGRQGLLRRFTNYLSGRVNNWGRSLAWAGSRLPALKTYKLADLKLRAIRQTGRSAKLSGASLYELSQWPRWKLGAGDFGGEGLWLRKELGPADVRRSDRYPVFYPCPSVAGLEDQAFAAAKRSASTTLIRL